MSKNINTGLSIISLSTDAYSFAVDSNVFVVKRSDSRVGLGTFLPYTKFDVRASGENLLWFTTPGPEYSAFFQHTGTIGQDNVIDVAAGATGSSMMYFSDTNTQGMGRIKYNHNTDSMNFYTGGDNHRVVIDSNGSVGIGTGTTNVHALLDLTSTTQGLLLPRMTGAEAAGIIPSVNGLMIYVTNFEDVFSPGFWGFEEGAWVKLSP